MELYDVDNIDGLLRLFFDRGGYAGLCFGYCAGREVIREEVRQMLNGSGAIADGQPRP